LLAIKRAIAAATSTLFSLQIYYYSTRTMMALPLAGAVMALQHRRLKYHRGTPLHRRDSDCSYALDSDGSLAVFCASKTSL